MMINKSNDKATGIINEIAKVKPQGMLDPAKFQSKAITNLITGGVSTAVSNTKKMASFVKENIR